MTERLNPPRPQAFSTEISRSVAPGQTAEVRAPTLGKYYTMLRFYDYERQNPFSPGGAVDDIARAQMALPLPIQMYDRNSSAYSQQNLGVLGDLLNLGSEFVSAESGSAQALRAAGTAAGVLEQFVAQGTRGLSRGIIDPSNITTAFEQYFGVIANPNPVARFQGPQLRNFNYTWYFSPKNNAESLNLQKIVRTIRKAALPGKTNNNTALLQIPQLVQMNFYPWDNGGFADNKWGWGEDSLIRMKRAHITNVNINWNPANVPAFFWDHNPVIAELSVEFLEVEYFFESDWTVDKDGSFSNDPDRQLPTTEALLNPETLVDESLITQEDAENAPALEIPEISPETQKIIDDLAAQGD